MLRAAGCPLGFLNLGNLNFGGSICSFGTDDLACGACDIFDAR